MQFSRVHKRYPTEREANGAPLPTGWPTGNKMKMWTTNGAELAWLIEPQERTVTSGAQAAHRSGSMHFYRSPAKVRSPALSSRSTALFVKSTHGVLCVRLMHATLQVSPRVRHPATQTPNLYCDLASHSG